MHEAGLVRSLVGKADAVVAAEGAERASSVTVRVGAMSHISPDHLRDYFVQEAKGTKVEGADLQIETDNDLTAPEAMDLVLVSVELDTPGPTGP
jgi:hydrogenase nickel incorporation protein HypA/HybF